MSHTPGKLQYSQHNESEWDIVTAFRDHVILCVATTWGGAGPDGSEENAEANARRLVACWNACDGISTAELESADGLGHAFLKIANHLSTVAEQRDEALAALDAVMQDIGTGWAHDTPQFEALAILEKHRSKS